MIFLPFNRHRRFTCLIALALCATSLYAQPNVDAINTLFTRDAISGTARSAGMGGAFGSVGADLSSLDINPAGLGLYRSSDICITPALRIGGDQSSYDGNNANGNHVSLEFAQAGAVFTKVYAKPDNSGGDMGFESHPLRAISFAINIQRDDFFNRTQNFGATNTNYSLVDYYGQYVQAIGQPISTGNYPIEVELLNQAGLLGNSGGSNAKAPVLQAGSISTRGGIDKIALGFGANIADKLYFGFGIAVPIVTYIVTPQISETNLDQNTASQFQTYTLTSQIKENGVGFTGNLGLIYKPISWMRFGVAYHLPTWYFMTENYSSDVQFADSFANTLGGPGEISGSYDATTYRIRAPMKGVASASFYLKDHGFISVDYEIENIGSTHYHFNDPTLSPYYDSAYNNYTKATYGFSHTLRIGIEGAIKVLRLRAGYAYNSTPFKSGQEITPGYNQSIQSATCGLGVRLKNFYVDLAYVFSYSKDAVSPVWFQIPFDQINSKYFSNTISLTLGWKISKSANGSSRKKAPVNNYSPPPVVDPGDRY